MKSVKRKNSKSVKLKAKKVKPPMQNLKTDLKKRTYIFALDVIKFIDELQKDRTCDVISKQLLRSASSIGANIIEVQASSSKKDFANFFNIALKSANETKFWLGLLRDSGKADRGKVNKLLDEVIQISNILGRSLITIREK